MTIENPAAFHSDRPAGFDGVFDWDFLSEAWPRRITPTDIDANVEINGHFLRFETKSPSIDANLSSQAGQRLSIYRDVIMSNGRVMYVMIGKGKDSLSGFRVVSFWKGDLMIGNAKKYVAGDIFDFCRVWAHFAESSAAWGGGRWPSLFAMAREEKGKSPHYRIPDCLKWKVIPDSGDKLRSKDRALEVARKEFDF